MNINRKLDFNSQTFFLSLLFMDKIFSLENLKIENENDYYLYSLCCLIIASKFNENDPHIPDLNSYIKIFNEVSKIQFNFSRDEIRNGEVIILRLLKYKLNYYSIYHFLVFFFVHGIVFEFSFKKIEKINKNYFSQKTYLEKIYILSRELLDLLVEDTNNFEIFNINNNYLIAAIILIFSIEKTLKINLENNENVFVNIYKLNLNIDEYKTIQNKIDEIYNEKIQNKSPRIFTSNINNNNKETTSYKKRTIKTNNENIENKTSNKIIISPNNRIYIDSGHYYQTNNDNFNNNTFVRLHSSNNFINPKLNSDNKLNNNDNKEKIKKDNYYISSKKRAFSSNKNENYYTGYKVNNTIHYENLSNNNLGNIGFASDGIKESSQLIRNEFLNNGNNLWRNSKKNGSFKTKSLSNFYKKIVPDDILDKTKAIFDKTNKQNNLRNDNYNLINNYNNIPNINGTGNTIIINNNININKYIDKKNINEIYPSYNNYKINGGIKNYDNRNYFNNNLTGIQQRYGYFGTYYDYGYESIKNNNTTTGYSNYNNYYNNNKFGYQSKNKYGLYPNNDNYYYY